jgi:hypothetical protein
MPAIEMNLQDSTSVKKFEEHKKIYYDSLKEYVAMLSAVPGSLKTELTGEQLAQEVIKGALYLRTYIETGAPPKPKNDPGPPPPFDQ